jgi:hypothetical protein
MVNITFEIEDFDLAEVILAIAGREGVTININTTQAVQVQEAPEPTSEPVEETVQAPVQQEAKPLPDLSKGTMTFEEANAAAFDMKNQGYSWSEIGEALGISGKSAARRVGKYEKQMHFQAEKARKEAEKPPQKPSFDGIEPRDIMQAVHAYVSSGSTSGAVYFASQFSNVLIASQEKRFADDEKLDEFKKTAHQDVREAFAKLGAAMGLGVAMAGSCKDHKGRVTTQLMILAPKRIPSFEDLWNKMIRHGMV